MRSQTPRLQEIVRRRRAFLTAMAELLRRRRAIQAGMQPTPERPEGSIAGLSSDYLRAADTVERVQQNLEKDHSLVRRFTGGIVHQVRLARMALPEPLERAVPDLTLSPCLHAGACTTLHGPRGCWHACSHM